jgi:hypothetical protein
VTAPRVAITEVIREVARHPVRHLVINWNWKAALLSAICRATLFLAINLPAGAGAGLRAMVTEFIFRGVASGVFGSLTQAFSRAHHYWIALALLPALGHTAEFLVHRAAGTPRLSGSIAASVAFSLLTTAFNLFAMRRGALVVGEGQRTLTEDLRHLPRLIVEFVSILARACVRRLRRPRRHDGDGAVKRAAVLPL